MAKSSRKTSPRRASKVKPAKTRGEPVKRNTSGLVPFKKGNPGRKKGPNKFTRLLKDAIVTAAEKLGRDGRGKDGTVGYLMWLARTEPAVYGRLLEKVMPMQLEVKDTTKKLYTAEEAKAELESRGLPVPQSLADLAVSTQRRRDEEDDELIQDDSEFNDLAPDTPELYSEDELDEGGDPDEDDNDDGQEAA